MGVVITAHFINPSLLRSMPFDTVKDLCGASTVAISHIVLVATPSLPANNLAELIALAKKNPGKLTYASPGTGASTHLAVELIKTMAGIAIVHKLGADINRALLAADLIGRMREMGMEP